MSALDDRKRGQEAKFTHDAEMRFKIAGRRARLAAKWVREHLPLTEEAAAQKEADYVALVVNLGAEHSYAATVEKLEADLAGEVDKGTIEVKLAVLHAEAETLVQAG